MAILLRLPTSSQTFSPAAACCRRPMLLSLATHPPHWTSGSDRSRRAACTARLVRRQQNHPIYLISFHLPSLCHLTLQHSALILTPLILLVSKHIYYTCVNLCVYLREQQRQHPCGGGISSDSGLSSSSGVMASAKSIGRNSNNPRHPLLGFFAGIIYEFI